MSQTSLYLPAPIYFSNPIKCSLRWCYSSWYYRDENTLVHKFNLWKSVEYQDSTIIAYSNDIETTYSKGSCVYILVPNNDLSKQKTILGTTKKLGTDYINQV
jgi:hypothetical protein